MTLQDGRRSLLRSYTVIRSTIIHRFRGSSSCGGGWLVLCLYSSRRLCQENVNVFLPTFWRIPFSTLLDGSALFFPHFAVLVVCGIFPESKRGLTLVRDIDGWIRLEPRQLHTCCHNGQLPFASFSSSCTLSSCFTNLVSTLSVSGISDCNSVHTQKTTGIPAPQRFHTFFLPFVLFSCLCADAGWHLVD